MDKIFNIEKFNLISDEENYYFFRALEPGDIEDLKKGIIKYGENYKKIRTDRERWQETHQEKPRWNEKNNITLEEIYNHIKMHYSLQTNCISLTSNANVARTYGETLGDKYVMIKVPKKEMGEKVFHAGEYMLDKIAEQLEEIITSETISETVKKELQEIEKAKTSNEIKEIIQTKYKQTQKIDKNKGKLSKGIKYKSPQARISSWQSLNEKQTLEKNKIIAKLTVLEHKNIIKPIIPHTSNNNMLVRTVGNAFASSEQIYYGDIEGERITDISKEILDIFGLLQQVKDSNRQIVEDLKKEVIRFIDEGKKIEIPENNILKNNTISIEKMYKLTKAKIEYGKIISHANKLYYLTKGQANARALSEVIRNMTNNNLKYDEIIKDIKENGFTIEPKVTNRQSNKGYKLSEAVNLDLKQNELKMIEQIKKLTDKEQEKIIQSGGLSNLREIIETYNSKEKISKERYYAEAIFFMYDWKNIGIEEFSAEEREKLIQKIQEKDCIKLYEELEQKGIGRNEIPKVLLNIITGKKEKLKEDLSIERVERFLGYYDVENTRIQLRPYQKRATEKNDEILKNNRFASLILPTGGGKSFVGIDQLMKHQNEKIIYFAPQNEILEQMKDYIIKYIHGPKNTLGKSKDEIVAEVFPNLKFATYPSLLSKEGEKLLKEQYDFIILDELHRTGATKWGDKLNKLLDNQSEKTKVLGLTATPRRDADGKNMANQIAERLGYTNKEAVRGKHIAMNMSLTNAIRMELVVNPKLVSCAYTLKTDGSIDKLKEKIDKIADIQVKNEKLKKYETLRRNLEEAEGIEEILKGNIKKGGKYIVFLPMIEKLEDEDGNVIGRKKGKDKILEYEKQISEYFQGSDIELNFHSMLGEYGDKENEKQLEEFQSRNTNDAEFMLVINKANEGLHLDKLDGIIWLRPMDENSRILYLQQLGRVIYAEDLDKPTKEEDRPVVIDLVNNTLKVNWENEITEQDDIEMMNLVIDWTEKHDGILPNINSKDKEETGYAKVLKEIQNKYKEYLNREIDDLSYNQIEEIQEIIELGAKIDLWQSELPDRITKKGEKIDNIKGKDYEGLFTLIGIQKDFIELEKEIEHESNSVELFIRKLEILDEMGVDVTKIYPRDTIETLAQKSRVQITEKEAKKLGIKLDYKIGNAKDRVTQAYRGNGNSIPPTKEQVNRLLELGIRLEKIERNATEEFIEKLEKLKELGIDVRKMSTTDTIETLAQKSRVQITEEQAKKLGIKIKEKISSTKKGISLAYRGKGTYIPPTKKQVDRLLELGISLEKIERNVTQEFIEKLEKLEELGINVSKMSTTDTIETLAQKSSIQITEEQAKRLGIKLNDKIGNSKIEIARIYRGKGRGKRKPPTKEQVERLLKLGISLEEKDKNITRKFIETLEILKEQKIDVSKLSNLDTIETLAEKSNIQITEEQAKKIGIKLDDKIGSMKHRIIKVYRGQEYGMPPTKEQEKELAKLGISLERKRRTSKEIAKASIGSIKDIELVDKEDKALKDLVEKKKEEQK